MVRSKTRFFVTTTRGSGGGAFRTRALAKRRVMQLKGKRLRPRVRKIPNFFRR